MSGTIPQTKDQDFENLLDCTVRLFLPFAFPQATYKSRMFSPGQKFTIASPAGAPHRLTFNKISFWDAYGAGQSIPPDHVDDLIPRLSALIYPQDDPNRTPDIPGASEDLMHIFRLEMEQTAALPGAEGRGSEYSNLLIRIADGIAAGRSPEDAKSNTNGPGHVFQLKCIDYMVSSMGSGGVVIELEPLSEELFAAPARKQDFEELPKQAQDGILRAESDYRRMIDALGISDADSLPHLPVEIPAGVRFLMNHLHHNSRTGQRFKILNAGVKNNRIRSADAGQTPGTLLGQEHDLHGFLRNLTVSATQEFSSARPWFPSRRLHVFGGVRYKDSAPMNEEFRRILSLSGHDPVQVSRNYVRKENELYDVDPGLIYTAHEFQRIMHSSHHTRRENFVASDIKYQVLEYNNLIAADYQMTFCFSSVKSPRGTHQSNVYFEERRWFTFYFLIYLVVQLQKSQILFLMDRINNRGLGRQLSGTGSALIRNIEQINDDIARFKIENSFDMIGKKPRNEHFYRTLQDVHGNERYMNEIDSDIDSLDDFLRRKLQHKSNRVMEFIQYFLLGAFPIGTAISLTQISSLDYNNLDALSAGLKNLGINVLVVFALSAAALYFLMKKYLK